MSCARFLSPILLLSAWTGALASTGQARDAAIAPHPVAVQALFVSLATLDDPAMVDNILDLRRSSRINALVIDVKAESGELSLPAALPFDVQDKARVASRSALLGRLLDRMRREGMYAIARIAVFKDDRLARSRARLGFRVAGGRLLQGKDGIGWTDPRNPDVQAYNIAVAQAAARAGFDEVQFDYVRFPGRKSASEEISQKDRRASINTFLSDAKAALARHDVFVSAAVFGYASWDRGDTNIGQNLEDIAARVDYVCLMLYPSLFRGGLPTARMPLDHPDRIVSLSLRRAQQRTGLPAAHFRPWLQAFGDHAFDGRVFGRAEIAAQTNAAETFGASGWMLWHPQSRYRPADLPPAR